MPAGLAGHAGADGIAFGDKHIGDAALAQCPRRRRALDAAADDDDVGRSRSHRCPGIQSVPASGTRAIAAASMVTATRSSGSRWQHVGLAAGARDGLRLHRQHPQIVGQPAAALDRVEPRGQLGVLGADARGVGAVLEVVEETLLRCRASRTRRRTADGCRRVRSARRCRSRRRLRRAPAPWRRRRRCGCRRTR